MKKQDDLNEKQKIEFIKDDIKKLKKAIGYEWRHVIHPPYLSPPDISVSEKIDQICKHLGIEIAKTEPTIKVVKKEDIK